MTNGARGDELIREIMCAVAEEYAWPDFHPEEHVLATVPTRVIDAYPGTYRLHDGRELVVRVTNGRAYLEGLTPDTLELLPESETAFFILTDRITFKFQNIGDAGAALTIYDGSDVLQATKVTK